MNLIPCEKLFSSLCFLKPSVWSFHQLCLNSLVARNTISPILGHDLIISNYCWLQHLPASWWGKFSLLKGNPLLGIRCAIIAILFPARAQSTCGGTHRLPQKKVHRLTLQSVLEFRFTRRVLMSGVPGRERGRCSRKLIYLFLFLLRECRQT